MTTTWWYDRCTNNIASYQIGIAQARVFYLLYTSVCTFAAVSASHRDPIIVFHVLQSVLWKGLADILENKSERWKLKTHHLYFSHLKHETCPIVKDNNTKLSLIKCCTYRQKTFVADSLDLQFWGKKPNLFLKKTKCF